QRRVCAAQQRIDLRARVVGWHAQEFRQRADEDACRDAEERDEHDREDDERPALEDRPQRVEKREERVTQVHRPLPFSSSATLSGVVAAHGRNTGVCAPSGLKVVSHSFWPLPLSRGSSRWYRPMTT